MLELGEDHKFKEDITTLNFFLSYVFSLNLDLHHLRIKTATDDTLVSRKMRSPLEEDIIYTFNCDPETADKDFLAAVQISDNRTKEAFQRYMSDVTKEWLQDVAKKDLINAIFHLTPCAIGDDDSRTAQREDFDLKANALGKWAE